MRKSLAVILTVLLTIVLAMPASGATYPSSVVAIPTRNTGDFITSDFFNVPNAELVAIEQALLNGTAHDLKPQTANTYNLGTVAVPWKNIYLGTTAAIFQGNLTGANVPAISITSTWNNAATNFSGIIMNITQTALANPSWFLRFQSSANDRFVVFSDGSTSIIGGGLGVGTGSDTTQATVRIAALGATLPVITIRGFASQTGDLLDLQNNAGSNIFQFSSLASMVNGIQFNPANTGSQPSIIPIGSDPNIGLTIAPRGNANAIIQPVSAFTGSTTALSVVLTWNSAGTTFPGALLVNAADTASAANSLVLELQRTGSDVFTVRKDGVTATGGTGFQRFGINMPTSWAIGTGLLGASIGFNSGAATTGLSLADEVAKTSTASFAALTGTWNAAAVVFPGALLVNVTGTAFGTGSLLADFQLGGVSKFKVDAAGNITAAGTGGILAGTSASIGGAALVAGACSTGTVTITGATTSMVAVAAPNTYPGDGTIWDAQVTTANTITVKVCAIVALTPLASTYNVRVLQ